MLQHLASLSLSLSLSGIQLRRERVNKNLPGVFVAGVGPGHGAATLLQLPTDSKAGLKKVGLEKKKLKITFDILFEEKCVRIESKSLFAQF